MREIKFRAWDGEYMYEFGLEDLVDGYIQGTGKILSEMKSVMQFTGLKDKNGKEIYEGDVIKWSEGALWTVRYDDKRGKWTVYDAQDTENAATFSLYSMVKKPVIGNIYENPELLTQHT